MTWEQAKQCMNAGLSVVSDHAMLGKYKGNIVRLEKADDEVYDFPYEVTDKDRQAEWQLDCRANRGLFREGSKDPWMWWSFRYLIEKWADEDKELRSGGQKFSRLDYFAECIDGYYGTFADDLRDLACAMREMVGMSHDFLSEDADPPITILNKETSK